MEGDNDKQNSKKSNPNQSSKEAEDNVPELTINKPPDKTYKRTLIPTFWHGWY